MSEMPNDELVLGGVEHIVHDYATLVLTGEGIPKGIPLPWNGPVEQSFHVQCRKFAYFFKNKGHGDDILAKHYIDPDATFDLATWEHWWGHHEKHLFHLTYARVRNKRPWTGYEEDRLFLKEFQQAWRKFWRFHLATSTNSAAG